MRAISSRRWREDTLAGSAGSAVRFPVRLGRGEPDSEVGQVGVGDCCSCLELWGQRDVMSSSPSFPSTATLRFLQSTYPQPRKQTQGSWGQTNLREKPFRSPSGRKLTNEGVARSYRSFLSISRSSCRLLHPGGRPWPQGLVSKTEGWELGTQLIGGEVKQVLGLESDRSSLTGVGLILREGFVLLSSHRFFSNSNLQTCPPPPPQGRGGGCLQNAPLTTAVISPPTFWPFPRSAGSAGPNFLTPLAQPSCHPACG